MAFKHYMRMILSLNVMYAPLQVTLVGSTVAWNRAIGRAGNGGGLLAAEDAFIQLSCILVHNNTATEWGGGMRLWDDSSIELQDSSIKYNTALLGGGTSFASNTSVPALAALLGVASNNTASVDGFDIAADPNNITLLSDESVFDYVGRAGTSEGALGVQLAVVGAAGIPAPGVLASAVMQGQQIFGANTSDESGIVYMFLRIRKPPGQYNVSL
jgi:hypothetical protein